MSALDTALDLAERHGFHILPCREKDSTIVIDGKERKLPRKSPYTRHGFMDASSDPARIREWWRRWPDALIGVRTGKTSDLFVVDVDPEGHEWYHQNASRLEARRVHKTERGYHLLYRDEGLGCSGKSIAPGVDSRGEGGYAIWWPAHGGEAQGELSRIAPLPQWARSQFAAIDGKKNSVNPAAAPGHQFERVDKSAAQTESDGGVSGDRSRDLLIRVAKDVRAGRADYEILALHRSHPHARGQGDADRAVQRCIDKVRKESVATTGVGREPAHDAAPSITLRPIAEIVAEQRSPRWLSPSLHRILERGVLAVIAGQRGTFKSFIALDWMLRAALDGEHVVILSGEGAGLDRRVDAWMRSHAPERDLLGLPVLALERPLNLARVTELAALVEAIEATGKPPAAILIDTFSKFAAGLDENDNAEVAGYLSQLSRALRERFDCTVILVAHAGHGDPRRPRGASALMANPDAEYIVERQAPPSMVCTVSRERFKDYPALDALAYQAEVIDLGRADDYGERVTSLVMRTTDAPPVRAQRAGANQLRALGALREWLRTHPGAQHITSADISDLLKAQGIDRRRRPDALNYLIHAGVMTNSIGGYTLNRDMA
jgi:hypothetical protein